MLAIAHRGYSERFPENSRTAYEGAIAAGAAFIESDARLTADGQVICCHDADFGRVSGQPLAIAETPSDVLAGLDIGDGQPPMRLSDVLDMARGRVRVLIDVKTDGLSLAEAVMDRVLDARAIASTVVGFRSISQVRYALERHPSTQCLGFVPDCDDIPQFLDAGAAVLRAWEEDINHPAVLQALRDGRRVWVTAGRRRMGEVPGFVTPERLQHLEGMCFEGVLLNDPSLVTGRKPERRK